MSLELDDVGIAGINRHPVTSSVKLHGPPGTGKTTQSAARVARLIRDEGYDISDVTWVTYRRSLAEDTLARLFRWGVVDAEEMENPKEGATKNIGTYHAVGRRLLSQDVSVVNGDRNTNHRYRFCSKDFLDVEYKKRSRSHEPKGRLMFSAFDYMAENLIDPTDGRGLQQCPEALKLTREGFNLGEAWEAWQHYKKQHDVIDFHEMLSRPLEMGRTPNTDILVVDEYHDAVPLYAKVANQWAADHEVVIVAGDPHQVVNSYQGASPEFFEKMDLPKVLLDKTYRVPVEHMALAHRVLSRAHTPPTVETTKNGRYADESSPPFYYRRELGEWETPGVDTRLSPAWLVEELGDDMMFLVRTRRQATGIAVALERAGILYTTQSNISGGWGDGRGGRNERRELFNALQKIRGVSVGDFTTGLSAYTGGSGASVDEKLTAEEYATLLKYARATTLELTRAEAKEQSKDALETGTEIPLRQLAGEVSPEFWEKYSKAGRALDDVNKGDLTERDKVALRAALERYKHPLGDSSSLKTKVYTIHASKGSEAQNVILYDGITSKIRTEMLTKEPAEKNEHRTWYVALTRAEETLMVLRDAFPWMEPHLPEDLSTTATRAANVEVVADD